MYSKRSHSAHQKEWQCGADCGADRGARHGADRSADHSARLGADCGADRHADCVADCGADCGAVWPNMSVLCLDRRRLPHFKKCSSVYIIKWKCITPSSTHG